MDTVLAAEQPVEVAGLQAEDDDEHAAAHEYNDIPASYSNYAGNGDRNGPAEIHAGVELSTRPSPHSFHSASQVKDV
jgi:hypothetical protein